MSITTGGWGGGTITSSGWGSGAVSEYLTALIAEYILSNAYSWVVYRDRVEVIQRARVDTVLPRDKSAIAQERGWGALLSRIKGNITVGRDRLDDITDRPHGDLSYTSRDIVVMRVKPSTLSKNEWQDLFNEVRGEVINRSKGWPWED